MLLTEPTSSEEVSRLLDRSGTIARGLGLSYGDCAINAGGQVIGTRRMGLVGLILRATIRLRRIETTYFHQKSIRVNDLENMLAALDEHDRTFPYSVATLDVMATGSRLGKGVLIVGDHAKLADLPTRLALQPLRISGPPKITVPFDLPEFTLNSLSVRAINAVIQSIQASANPFGHYDAFFCPLDKIANWNRGYGRRGFTQYQFVIPFENGPSQLRKILTAILSSGELPFLNVLKRLGRKRWRSLLPAGRLPSVRTPRHCCIAWTPW
jgi:decaprenylphospho-beta-D-ribofuranose 2-oxidase